jgi:type IX secretion system PorP/SprF family membrane protein
MKIRSLVATAAVFTAAGFSVVSAQQDPYFTHFAFNKLFYNPAAAGESGKWCVNAISHQQWRGYDDRTFEYTTPAFPTPGIIQTQVGPRTSGFGFSAPISKTKNDVTTNYGGIGVSYYTDKVAYELNTNFRVHLAGAINMTDGSQIRIGADVGMLQKELDGGKLRPLMPNDPFIPNGKFGDQNMTLGVGLMYRNPNMNDLYVGLSATNMVPQNYLYGTTAGIQVTTVRHTYAVAGMTIPNFMNNPNLEFMPAALLKINTKAQLDLSALVKMNNLFAGGLAYRTESDALSVLIGYYAKPELRIGYSYDITMTRIQTVSNGTHELQVNYCFTIRLPEPPPPIIILTPRHMMRDNNIE